MRIAKKATLLGAAAALTTAGLIAGLAAPASAEPRNPNPTSEANEVPLVGVGSDTIQDLLTGYSAVAKDFSTGSFAIASYDAVAPGSSDPTVPTFIKPRVNGDVIQRPNGSGDGLKALRAAVDAKSTWNTQVTSNGNTSTVASVLQGSDIQFARSSDASSITTGGKYAQIPIAIDAVTYATSASSQIPSGIPLGTSVDAASNDPASPAPLTLKNIFSADGYLSGTINGTSYKFYVGGASTVDSAYTRLHVYAPQTGSGTLKFWYKTINGSDGSSLPTGVSQTYVNANSATVGVEEHDGSALQNDPVAIAPFSIAQWLAQSKSASIGGAYGITVNDRRHGAVLNSIGSVAPTTGGSNAVLNTSFPVTRPVFIRVEYSQLKINPYLKAAFVSNSNFALTTSIYDATNPLNPSKSLINDFGFAKIPSGGATFATTGTTVFKAGDADDYRFN
jgi:hypothetical protein